MACTACTTKFNLFKRKKHCMDCLRYFCSECVLKRSDKVFTCENCALLSRRPLVRNQLKYMRSRDLRQYLLAKKVSIKGCVEKEDLIHMLMIFANGSDSSDTDHNSTNYSMNVRSSSTIEGIAVDATSSRSEDIPNVNIENDELQDEIQVHINPAESGECELAQEANESDNNIVIEIASDSTNSTNSTSENNKSVIEEPTPTTSNSVQIEEILENNSDPINYPEPVITEQDEVSETSNTKQSDMITEIPTWPDNLQLSDIKDLSELEYLTVKQLKILLITNRVDYKGCIERQELLNKVSRLWQEYTTSRSDVEKLSEEELCKICWDAPIECIILECGHMACCVNCGKQMSECPICKQYVVRVVRFFKA